jgi:SAM-dependent methyltransferase
MDIDFSSPNLPSPALFLESAMAYRRTAALRAAIELDVFTTLATGPLDAASLAQRCSTNPRGMRILCDVLATLKILHKENDLYSLTMEASIFLSRLSPACMADAFQFLSAPFIQSAFAGLADAVRTGGTEQKGSDVLAAEHEFWLGFARSMAPMMAFPAEMIAERLGAAKGEPWNVLDIAAGHGVFGIALARQNPNATITALDWPAVLDIAVKNAQEAGIAARYHTKPGSAFDLDLGSGYHIVLLTNFLHHFDAATNEALLRRVRAALVPGGRVAILEFVPNSDRLAPEFAVMFSMNMLVHTAAGDAYTFPELDGMLQNAGFQPAECHPLLPGPQSLLVSEK